MRTQSQKIQITVLALVAFMALVFGLFVSKYFVKGSKIDNNTFHGTWLQKPRPVNPFELTGIDGKKFNNQSLHGKWTFVFFGFTNCGYVCPTTMAELGAMYRSLVKSAVTPLPNVVMVSIDPERDSILKISDYVRSFDKHFYGARGDRSTVKKMTREMGVAYTKVATTEGDKKNYDIQHSGAVMVFNPKGELNAFFTTPHEAESMVKDYQLIVG